MAKVTRATLVAVSEQLAGHPWRQAEIDELVAPRLGIITGLQDLLDDLEALRRVDLGATPPAQGVRRQEGDK